MAKKMAKLVKGEKYPLKKGKKSKKITNTYSSTGYATS